MKRKLLRNHTKPINYSRHSRPMALELAIKSASMRKLIKKAKLKKR